MERKLESFFVRWLPNVNMYALTRGLGYIIVVFTLTLMAVLYYILWKTIIIPWEFFRLEEFGMEEVLLFVFKLMALVAYHILAFVFLLYAYCKAVWGDPGYVPLPSNSTPLERKQARMLEDEEEASLTENQKTLSNRNGNSSRSNSPEKQARSSKYCYKCEIPKNRRTHHCKLCNRCIQSMDHHCPFIANCVGHKNVKAFILFLFSASSTFAISITLWVIRIYNEFTIRTTEGSLIYRILSFENIHDKEQFFMCFVAIYLSSALFAGAMIMGVVTTMMVRSGQTQIDILSQGKRRCNSEQKNYNWRKVMGNNVWEWLQPWIESSPYSEESDDVFVV